MKHHIYLSVPSFLLLLCSISNYSLFYWSNIIHFQPTPSNVITALKGRRFLWTLSPLVYFGLTWGSLWLVPPIIMVSGLHLSGGCSLFFLLKTFPPKLVLLDFSDIDRMEDVITEISECYGYVDVLICNGSMKVKAPVQSLSLEMDKIIMDVNYFGPVTLAKGMNVRTLIPLIQ